MFFEEVKFADSKKFIEKLNAHITTSKINIEGKYKDKGGIPNIIRNVFTSNDDCPVPVQVGNRRFLLIKCSTKHKGDTKYWDEIYRNINCENSINVLFQQLLNHDIPVRWNALENVPITKENEIQEKSNIHPMWAMLDATFNSESINFDSDTVNKGFLQPDGYITKRSGKFENQTTNEFYIRAENFQERFLQYCEDTYSYITRLNFKARSDIHIKLRDCEAITSVQRRIPNGKGDSEKITFKFIKRNELVEFIKTNNFVCTLLDAKILKQEEKLVKEQGKEMLMKLVK